LNLHFEKEAEMEVKEKSTPRGTQAPAVSDLLDGIKGHFDQSVNALISQTTEQINAADVRIAESAKAADDRAAESAKAADVKIELVASEQEKKFGQVKSMLEGFGVKLDDSINRIEDLESKGQQPPAQARAETAGELAVKGLKFGTGGKILAPRSGYTDPVKIPSLLTSGQKATVLASSELGAAAVPVYREGILEKLQEAMDVASRLPYIPMPGAESYIIRKETVKSREGVTHTTLDVDIDGDPTPKTTATLTSVDGLAAGMYVTFFATSAHRKKVVSFVPSTGVVTFATDALDFDMSAGGDVTFANYGTTAEEASKPYGFLEVESVTKSFQTLATIIALTNQRLNAAPSLNAWVQGKLRERARRNLSWHVLYGTGTNSLDGFASESGAQTYAWSTGSTGDNRLDAMVRAASMIVGMGVVTFVMNKNDLFKLMLLKGSDGHYINSERFGTIPITGVSGQIYIGPYAVVVDDAVEVDEFFAIDFANASELVDQQTSQLLFGYINDDFEKNIIRARYEDALIHAILSTDAYVYGSWDNAPT
jgi:hypothetical protein